MRKSGPSFLITLIFLILVVSCSPAVSPTGTLQPTANLLPTSAPVDTAAPLPTSMPTAPGETATSSPALAESVLPTGIATYQSDSASMNYFDLSGKLFYKFPVPNLGTGLFQQAAIAGRLSSSSDSPLPFLIYYVPGQNGELWLTNGDINEKLVNAPKLLNIIGAPGGSTLAYTLLDYTDNGLRSLLYLGDLESLPSAQPVIDNTNTEALAVKPLMISIKDGKPAGIWYTNEPNGIGGDIVFMPLRSLNYLDLASNTIKTYLDMITTPAGISQDGTWVAYSYAEGVSPLSIAHNFDFSTAVVLPLREDSDRGAGDAVFSPGNQYVAWREAGGSIAADPPNFHETIRIAKVDGTILAEIPDTSLTEASGFQAITWMIPVGWLDEQTLVAAVRGNEPNTAAVLSVKSDGSSVTYLAPGEFIGFLYP